MNDPFLGPLLNDDTLLPLRAGVSDGCWNVGFDASSAPYKSARSFIKEVDSRAKVRGTTSDDTVTAEIIQDAEGQQETALSSQGDGPEVYGSRSLGDASEADVLGPCSCEMSSLKGGCPHNRIALEESQLYGYQKIGKYDGYFSASAFRHMGDATTSYSVWGAEVNLHLSPSLSLGIRANSCSIGL